jgi:hypothetical protein
MTIVTVGKGNYTAFWLDSWLNKKPLACQYPHLFSHVVNKNVTVLDCRSDFGWQIRTRALTSQRAEHELLQLLNQLDGVQLTDLEDTREMRFGPTKDFTVRTAYFMLTFGGVICPIAQDIWSSLAPKKCKIFAWQAAKGRLKTRDILAKKNIIDNALCPYGCDEEENVEHMLFRCPYATQVWTALGFALNQQTNMAQALLAAEQIRLVQAGNEAATILIAIAWNIWLARNRKVFDNVTTPCSAIKENIVQTLQLWKHRTRKEPRSLAIEAWTQIWEQPAARTRGPSN